MALHKRLDESMDQVIEAPLHDRILGEDPRIVELRNHIEQIAPTRLAVLITGETGTGKDIVAMLLHRLSEHSERPFVKVNCPSIPESLFESELLGYERGAFTGATGSHPGRFELARDGTLFLDEISEISPYMQTKLLQILDGEPYLRVGGTKPMQAHARVVAATNVPLEIAIENGRLRKDVAFRLGEAIIHIPPLRERRGDIPLLAEHFNYNMCKVLKKPYTEFSADITEQLQRMDWPGNVRELAGRVREYVTTGLVEKLVASESIEVPPGHQSQRTTGRESTAEKQFPSLKEAAKQAVESAERALIEEVLRYTLWNRRKAAKLLKTSYSSLLRRIESYNIGKN